VPTEFERVEVPRDQQELVGFLCDDEWPFHGRRRLTPRDVLAMDFSTPDVTSFWILDDRERVGLIRLLDLGDIGEGAPQFDLRIARAHRGRGHGKRAARWIVDHLFTAHPELHRVEANTRSDNVAMRTVLSAVGFTHEGRLRDAWPGDDGQWFDTMIYGMLRSDRTAERVDMAGVRFRMGSLDHVHIRVPDRAEAVAWYARHLGFEPVEAFDFWATGFEGGPVQISADGGRTMLALFEASEGHPMVRQETGVAFTVDADAFIAFTRSLPGEIQSPAGRPLLATDVVDFDLCWAIDLVDPWGNRYELNCYDYDRIKTELIEHDRIEPVRYWQRELFESHLES
jgi:RimJ/RimL family protein N-acetyltransferase/catechol 2,3-dioxygenase-like lactoylglutathione lyase family enzyme